MKFVMHNFKALSMLIIYMSLGSSWPVKSVKNMFFHWLNNLRYTSSYQRHPDCEYQKHLKKFSHGKHFYIRDSFHDVIAVDGYETKVVKQYHD